MIKSVPDVGQYLYIRIRPGIGQNADKGVGHPLMPFTTHKVSNFQERITDIPFAVVDGELSRFGPGFKTLTILLRPLLDTLHEWFDGLDFVLGVEVLDPLIRGTALQLYWN